jgi:hypothetical protein
MSCRTSNPVKPGGQHTQLRSVILTRQSLCIRNYEGPSLGRELGGYFFRHDINSCEIGRSIEPRYMPQLTSNQLCSKIAETSQLGKNDSYMRDILLHLSESCDSASMRGKRYCTPFLGTTPKHGI